MKEESRVPAYLAALGYALVIGFSFMFTKIALDHSNPVDMLAYRFIVSFIAISIPVLSGHFIFRSTIYTRYLATDQLCPI